MNIVSTSSLNYSHLKEKTEIAKKGFNQFKGDFISEVVEYEETMQIIFLNLISKGDEDIKEDIFECFINSDRFLASAQFAVFDRVIKKRFELYKELKSFIDSFQKLLEKFILFRNNLAHTVNSVEFVSNVEPLIHTLSIKDNSKGVKFTRDLEIEVKIQTWWLNKYLDFLEKVIVFKDNSESLKINFYATIGHYNPKYLLNKELTAKDYKKFKNDFLTIVFHSNPEDKLFGVYKLHKNV